MIAGTVFVVLLALATVVWLAIPLLRKDAVEAERVAVELSEEQDLESRRNMVLAALKDLEDDRATGKMDEQDFAELHDRLSAQAVEIMKRLDQLEADHVEREADATRRRRPILHPRAGRSPDSEGSDGSTESRSGA